MKSRVLKSKRIDLKGVVIPKGTKIYIVEEFDMVHYRTKQNEHFTKCLIDNGIDINKAAWQKRYELMPETVFKELYLEKWDNKLGRYITELGQIEY